MKTNKEKLLAEKICFHHQDFKVIATVNNAKRGNEAFHEEIEIKCYYEGVSNLMIDGGIFVAKPGDITIANPYEIHANLNDEKETGKYVVLVVDLDFLEKGSRWGLDLRQALISKGQKFVNHIIGNERLCAIMMRVYEEITQKKDNYRVVVYGLVLELFVLLLRDYVNENKSLNIEGKEIKRAELISPALSKIFTGYKKRITVTELADLCGVSEYHFCRMFKQVTGLTVVQYIVNYRISLAEMMLTSGDAHVEDVAYECGFEDLSYFYRCYKKLKGVSPKKARIDAKK